MDRLNFDMSMFMQSQTNCINQRDINVNVKPQYKQFTLVIDKDFILII